MRVVGGYGHQEHEKVHDAQGSLTGLKRKQQHRERRGDEKDQTGIQRPSGYLLDVIGAGIHSPVY